MQSEFKNRRLSLTIGGLIQVGLAGLALLQAVSTFVFSFALHPNLPPGITASQIRFGALIPASIGIILGTLGIGSMLARRWARALTVVGSWFGLVTGITISTILFLRSESLFPKQLSGGQLPEGSGKFIVWVMIVVLGFLYVLLPALFLVLFSGRNAKLTCEERNPAQSWTDKVPLPVLGAVLTLVFTAACTSLLQFLYRPIFPLFGTFLTGNPAIVVNIVVGIIFLFLARGLYQLNRSALYLTLAFYALWGASSSISFYGLQTEELYRLMALPDAQLATMKDSSFQVFFSPRWAFYCMVPMFLYGLWLTRYFKKAE